MRRWLRVLPLSKHMFDYEEDPGTFTHTYLPSPQIVLEQIVPNYAIGLLYGAMIELTPPSRTPV